MTIYFPFQDADDLDTIPFELDYTQTRNAVHGEQDYRYEDDLIGGAEVKGLRGSQEDRMQYHVFAPHEQTSLPCDDAPGALTQILGNAFSDLNQRIKQNALTGGSTGIVSVVTKDSLTVANLGDSEVYVLGLDDENNIVEPSKRINTLHQPNTELENKRLVDLGLPPMYGRLGGSLAVSRAFGDLGYEKNGLSHEPDTFNFDLKQNPKVTQWVIITACDGLTEHPDFNETNIEAIVKKNIEHTPGIIAQALIHGALNSDKGSRDNISLHVAKINKHQLNQHDFKSIVMAVFDGHGGQQTSQFLADYFVSTFLSKLFEYATQHSDTHNDTQAVRRKFTNTPPLNLQLKKQFANTFPNLNLRQTLGYMGFGMGLMLLATLPLTLMFPTLALPMLLTNLSLGASLGLMYRQFTLQAELAVCQKQMQQMIDANPVDQIKQSDIDSLNVDALLNSQQPAVMLRSRTEPTETETSPPAHGEEHTESKGIRIG